MRVDCSIGILIYLFGTFHFSGKLFNFYNIFWSRRGEVCNNDGILRYTNTATDIVCFVIEDKMDRVCCTHEIE